MRLVELVGTEVVSEDGRHLGLLMDVRCDFEPAANLVVDEIVYGEAGWLERLGIRAMREKTSPWKSVRSISRKRIVVAA